MSFFNAKYAFHQNPGYAEGSNIYKTYLDQLGQWNPMAKGAKRLLSDLLHGHAEKNPLIAKMADIAPNLAAVDANMTYDPQLPPELVAKQAQRTKNEMMMNQGQAVVDSTRGIAQGLLSMQQQGRQFKQSEMGNTYRSWGDAANHSYQGGMEGGAGMGLLQSLIAGGSQIAAAGLKP